jgi:outer membrane protein OmpA-like peptidoglycan-associated protein
MRPPTDCRRRAAAAVGLLLVAASGGCAHAPPPVEAPTEKVILLPESDGRRTAVTVRQGERQLVLDQPYAGAQAGSAAGLRSFQSNAQEVRTAFGAALAALPQRPVSFQLYFVEGSLELTGESKATVELVFTEIAGRPAPEVMVIGHTDSLGGDAANDALSLQRAEAIRAELVRRGIKADSVQAVGRGERELLVPTGDEVAEPRNRRVEINVR